MTGSQYNNVVHWTLANGAVDAADSAAVSKAIFDNCGVAFPTGDCMEVLLTLMSEDYMGWRSCTAAQAQELANEGVAVVGVTPEKVMVITPEDTMRG